MQRACRGLLDGCCARSLTRSPRAARLSRRQIAPLSICLSPLPCRPDYPDCRPKKHDFNRLSGMQEGRFLVFCDVYTGVSFIRRFDMFLDSPLSACTRFPSIARCKVPGQAETAGGKRGYRILMRGFVTGSVSLARNRFERRPVVHTRQIIHIFGKNA